MVLGFACKRNNFRDMYKLRKMVLSIYFKKFGETLFYIKEIFSHVPNDAHNVTLFKISSIPPLLGELVSSYVSELLLRGSCPHIYLAKKKKKSHPSNNE